MSGSAIVGIRKTWGMVREKAWKGNVKTVDLAVLSLRFKPNCRVVRWKYESRELRVEVKDGKRNLSTEHAVLMSTAADLHLPTLLAEWTMLTHPSPGRCQVQVTLVSFSKNIDWTLSMRRLSVRGPHRHF